MFLSLGLLLMLPTKLVPTTVQALIPGITHALVSLLRSALHGSGVPVMAATKLQPPPVVDVGRETPQLSRSLSNSRNRLTKHQKLLKHQMVVSCRLFEVLCVSVEGDKPKITRMVLRL
jgi:hypothetical protein